MRRSGLNDGAVDILLTGCEVIVITRCACSLFDCKEICNVDKVMLARSKGPNQRGTIIECLVCKIAKGCVRNMKLFNLKKRVALKIRRMFQSLSFKNEQDKMITL